MTEILRVERHARVRFPYVEPTADSDGPSYEVVRVVKTGGKNVKPLGDKHLVALRHSLRWRTALGAIAFASDRSLSSVVGRLLSSNQVGELRRAGLPPEILDRRGRPSTNTENTINVVVERDTANANAFTSDLIGDYCDQAYYLTTEQIATLEGLAQQHELSPGQVIDALVLTTLALDQ